MVKVKIKNPTQATRSYSWIPMGVTLAPGESKIFNFDPFVSCKNGMQLNILSRDVRLGFVELTYSVEKPCKIVDIDSLKEDTVITVSDAATGSLQKPYTDKQIRPSLDVADDTKNVDIVSLETNKEIPNSVAKPEEVVDVFNNKSLIDDGVLEVAAPAVKTTAKQPKPKASKQARKVQA